MRNYWILIVLFFLGFILSGIKPHDTITWLLEVFPAIAGFLILFLTFKTFKFTFLVYCLILAHCYLLFIGGHYTYAEVPIFDWIKEILHQNRNNYDKVGHFAQGFVPAIIVRELFIRKHVVKAGNWLAFLTLCVCLTISVFYEFLEWFVAIVSGESADSFLGTQGYVWDTQSDMLFAAVGAVCMLLFLSKIHSKQIAKLNMDIL